MAFERKFDEKLINGLKEESLFNEYLLKDIKNGDVFPAIRNNEIHFYYKGGRLFKYTSKGFISNIKYAFACSDKTCGDIEEVELKNLKPIDNFTQGYESIKECCKMYADGEASNVSKLFKNYSYVISSENEVLLDIEAVLESKDELKCTDRFDLVLFDKNARSLQIAEAKLYCNPEIYSKNKNNPEVVSQIERYENNIEKCEAEIIEQYKNYIKIVNEIFDIELPQVEKINKNVNLIIFDFDKDKRDSEKFKNMKENLKNNIKGSKIYTIGHAENTTLSQLF